MKGGIKMGREIRPLKYGLRLSKMERGRKYRLELPMRPTNVRDFRNTPWERIEQLIRETADRYPLVHPNVEGIIEVFHQLHELLNELTEEGSLPL